MSTDDNNIMYEDTAASPELAETPVKLSEDDNAADETRDDTGSNHEGGRA